MVLIQVTIYDEDTHAVQEQFVEQYGGSYGWEIERVFSNLGEKIAKKIDPEHYTP